MPANHAVQSGIHKYADRGTDLYETPACATTAFIKQSGVHIPKTVWQPACGRGAQGAVLRAHGHTVIASTLVDHADHLIAGIETGVDFYAVTSAPPGCDFMMTNPPYMRRGPERFVEHGLTLVRHVVIFAALRFMETKRPILDSGMWVSVHPFRQRLPMMHRDGWVGEKTKSSPNAFAWFYFDREHDGSPAIVRRLSIADNDNKKEPWE